MSEVGDIRDHGHEFPAHYKVMLDKLNEQRQLDQFTDITLIVDGHQFRAHKAVLAACSQFFHKFFQDFTQEPLVEIEGNKHKITILVFNCNSFFVWCRMNGITVLGSSSVLVERSKPKKRKIAETSNVITETLPLAETETVEIEVEVGDEAIEVQEAGLEEVVDAGRSSDDSALALLADITSKYQQGEQTVHVVKKGDEETVVLQEEAVMATKTLEGMEVVEVQISQLDNMFRCDKCDRCFKLFYHLKQHMKTHTAGVEKPFICKHCGRPYAREGALKQHLNTYHFDAEEQSHRQKKKVHVCAYCNKQFDHFGHFKEHLRKHTEYIVHR
uniref:Zinc finger protein 131 n=1 Tax=Astyanax mexicanus TaxID=7994 RepID=A0A8B9H5P3_ASTMX